MPAGRSGTEAVGRHLNSFSVKINDSRKERKKNPSVVCQPEANSKGYKVRKAAKRLPGEVCLGLYLATEALMNYSDNAPDRKMSKPVGNGRENNEGYFPKTPNHTNDLSVRGNRGTVRFLC